MKPNIHRFLDVFRILGYLASYSSKKKRTSALEILGDGNSSEFTVLSESRNSWILVHSHCVTVTAIRKTYRKLSKFGGIPGISGKELSFLGFRGKYSVS